ncbi:MAG: hypothetical protein ABI723_18985 [Bacteroidia bacterium]
MANKNNFAPLIRKLIDMKRVIAFTVVLIGLISFKSQAQEYQTGIGIRVGFDNGLTVKHFIADRNAIEGIVSFYREGLLITGLYEIQNNKAFKVDHLDWYYGFGGHLGFWNEGNSPYNEDNKSSTVIGIDGIIGLEYSFTEVPISLSFDFKPMINLIDDSGFYGDFAISARYNFK